MSPDNQGYDRLRGVHPQLVEAVKKMLYAGHELGQSLMIVEGLRTAQRQADLYKIGRTLPGTIVTHADGFAKKSNHQEKPDGFGHAVDLCFLDKDGKPSWDEKNPWVLIGAMADALGLKWGGNFASLYDPGHVELPYED